MTKNEWLNKNGNYYHPSKIWIEHIAKDCWRIHLYPDEKHFITTTLKDAIEAVTPLIERDYENNTKR